MLELCRGNNLFIVNGRIGDDYLESGRLTCRNSSVVDYYICSPCFFEYFCNFKVVDFSRLYSDVHSPLVATLQFNEKAAGHDQFQSSDHTIDGRIKKWDNKKCLTFQDNAQGLGASEKKKKKILYNTTRGRTHLLPFF